MIALRFENFSTTEFSNSPVVSPEVLRPSNSDSAGQSVEYY